MDFILCTVCTVWCVECMRMHTFVLLVYIVCFMVLIIHIIILLVGKLELMYLLYWSTFYRLFIYQMSFRNSIRHKNNSEYCAQEIHLEICARCVKHTNFIQMRMKKQQFSWAQFYIYILNEIKLIENMYLCYCLRTPHFESMLIYLFTYLLSLKTNNYLFWYWIA